MLNLKDKRKNKKRNYIKELHTTQPCSHCSFRFTVKSELKAANQQQALGIAILLLVLIISPIIIFLVRCLVICTSNLFFIPFVRNATATIHIFSLTLSTKEQVVSCHQWSQCELPEICCVGDRNWYKRSRKWRIFCISHFHFQWQGT